MNPYSRAALPDVGEHVGARGVVQHHDLEGGRLIFVTRRVPCRPVIAGISGAAGR
jgi:hypothetical protein